MSPDLDTLCLVRAGLHAVQHEGGSVSVSQSKYYARKRTNVAQFRFAHFSRIPVTKGRVQVRKRRNKLGKRPNGGLGQFQPHELPGIPEDYSRSTTGSVIGSDRAGNSSEQHVHASAAASVAALRSA
jgi:hypothetical protein